MPVSSESYGRYSTDGNYDVLEGEEVDTKADVYVKTGLFPEEFVLRVVEANGGRIRQQGICSRTGWSDGAVSRILSKMEDAGAITRVRIGRGKIVCLPDAKAEILDSSDPDEES